MQKATKKLLKDNLLYIALFITVAIGVLSLIKVAKVPNGIPFLKFDNADKIHHLVSYFCLCLCWLLTIKNTSEKRYLKFTVVISCIIYGTIIEVMQGTLTNYRTADYKDIIANSIGVLFALLIFNRISLKK